MFNEPLGLPQGTVRAILALTVLLFWIILGGYALFAGGVDAAYEILTSPPAIVTLIMGYYFGKRAGDEKS